MLVSGVSRGGDEIKLIQYRKVTKLNAKIPSLFSCQEGGRNFFTECRLSSELSVHHKVLKIHSVCPLVGIGTPPHPSPECVLPPEPEGGGGCTCRRERGRESPNSDDRRKSLAICRLCGVHCTVSSTVRKLISMYRPSFDLKTFPIECGCIKITLGG
jgi:hypothetical protein